MKMTKIQHGSNESRQPLVNNYVSQRARWQEDGDEVERWTGPDHHIYHSHSSSSQPPWAHPRPQHSSAASSSVRSLPFRSPPRTSSAMNSSFSVLGDEMDFGTGSLAFFDDELMPMFEGSAFGSPDLSQTQGWPPHAEHFGSAALSDNIDVDQLFNVDPSDYSVQDSGVNALDSGMLTPTRVPQSQKAPHLTTQSSSSMRTSAPTDGPVTYPELRPRPQWLFNQSPHVSSFAHQTAQQNVSQSRRGRLTIEGRENARKVRNKGACFRCRRMKEKCDDQDPCTPCEKKKKRNWPFPCVRESLDSRWMHLVPSKNIGLAEKPSLTKSPAEFIGHLEYKTWREFTSQIHHDRYVGQEFIIQLRQDFLPPLEILVREFVPQSENDLIKDVFPIEKDGDDFRVQQQKLVSPPLVPSTSLNSWKPTIEAIVKQTSKWLENLESDKDARWHETFFPEAYGQSWPRELLGDVCKFFHEVMYRSCKALRAALKATVILYMIGHIFFIPTEQVEKVLGGLNCANMLPREYSEFVCPRYVDRFLKVILYPFLQKGLAKTFDKLQQLYELDGRNVTRMSRDRYLASTIAVLIIAGTLQAKAMEKALTQMRQGEIQDLKAAIDHVQEIEKLVVEPLFVFWDDKFNIKHKLSSKIEASDRQCDSRVRAFDLFGRFKASYGRHVADLESLDTNLPEEPDGKTFSAMNINRLLKKFHILVFYGGIDWKAQESNI